VSSRATMSISAPRPLGLFVSAAWLLGVTVLVYALVAATAVSLFGAAGVWAATVAMLVCLGGGVLALVATHWVKGPMQPLATVALGMLARVAAPLACCMVLMIQRGPLLEAGFVVDLLVFYVATLGVETWLAVGRAQPPAAEET